MFTHRLIHPWLIKRDPTLNHVTNDNMDDNVYAAKAAPLEYVRRHHAVVVVVASSLCACTNEAPLVFVALTCRVLSYSY